jgi:hypothetical protein
MHVGRTLWHAAIRFAIVDLEQCTDDANAVGL